MKKILQISLCLLLLASAQALLAHSPPDSVRPISNSASQDSNLTSLVQGIQFQHSQLAIKLQTSEETNISVYNLMGQLIASRTLSRDHDQEEVIIPMNRFQEGTYLIFIKSPHQLQSYSLNTGLESALP